jgi:hypothetical protein
VGDLITSVTQCVSGGRAVRGTKECMIVGKDHAIQGRCGELLEAKGEELATCPSPDETLKVEKVFILLFMTVTVLAQ